MNMTMAYDQHDAVRVARLAGLPVPPARCVPMAADGSSRRFFRLIFASGPNCVVVFPASAMDGERAMAEARATAEIGRHLARRGISVPRLLHADTSSGALLFEDCGDTLLHDIVGRHRPNVLSFYYRLAVEELVKFHVEGARGFDPSWCWDTPRYDRRLMVERESMYFYRAFCQDRLGMGEVPAELMTEFSSLAARVAREPADCLIHRDFQCRNLMVRGSDIVIIDYQGARLGPAAYDLASLVNDPYAGLADDVGAMLIDHYLAMRRGLTPLDEHGFRRGYHHAALQRYLQVVGAYAYLSAAMSKGFFAAYISPALRGMSSLLHGPLDGRYPRLAALCVRIFEDYHHVLERVNDRE